MFAAASDAGLLGRMVIAREIGGEREIEALLLRREEHGERVVRRHRDRRRHARVSVDRHLRIRLVSATDRLNRVVDGDLHDREVRVGPPCAPGCQVSVGPCGVESRQTASSAIWCQLAISLDAVAVRSSVAVWFSGRTTAAGCKE